MGPRTGPRPASSTPRQTGGAEEGSEGEGRREEGMGEKCVKDAPVRIEGRWTEGGMNVDSSAMLMRFE